MAGSEKMALRFLLGHEPRALEQVDPTLTVLNYLRTVERRCGTKEGCAEGDCGACTVALGEVHDGCMRYRAVNACILFMPMLDGRQLVTVEDLKDAEGGPHPAQQALVECHASQCGFCTPGFAMSLFALHASEPVPSRSRINDVLAGNLCRCTGYRPIVDAALRMYELPGGDTLRERQPGIAARLLTFARTDTLALEHEARRWFAPRTTDALAELYVRHPDAVLVAGATDVGLWVTKQHREIETIIYLGEIAALRQITETADELDIGATVTYTRAMHGLARHFPDFGELLRRLGSVQIRNAGTFGGNIANASPIGDSMPALIALGARLVLRRGRQRRELPLEDFFLDYRKTAAAPGEFIERIRVPVGVSGLRFHTYKVSKRLDQDISAVCGAYALILEAGRVRDARICYGGMAATPKRAHGAETALRGRPWNETTLEAAMEAMDADYQPLSDMRASAAYRSRVARNLLRRLYLETTDSGIATRVTAPAEVSL